MDKNKLLNNLKSRRDAWNESLINTMKENIKTEASLKILDDIIAEVEDEKKPDFLSLDDIVKGMKDYCEIVYHYSDGEPKCDECPFSLQKLLGVEECMMKLIESNIANNKKN
jgi:hypothetical protein